MKLSLTPNLAVTISAGVLFIVLVALISSGTTQGADVKILSYLADFRSPKFDRFFYMITWLGSLYLLIPTAVIIVGLLYRNNFQTEVFLVISSFTAAIIMCRLLKYLIGRDRPNVSSPLFETISGYSFPSCHVTQATAFFIIFYIVVRNVLQWNKVVIGVGLAFLLFGVSMSRMYLQVHYPTDVIGGILLGVICVFGAEVFFVQRNC